MSNTMGENPANTKNHQRRCKNTGGIDMSIDWTKIAGYREDMTADEKLALLEMTDGAAQCNRGRCKMNCMGQQIL